MKQYFVFECRIDSDDNEACRLFGPFDNHPRANGFMQKMYDNELENPQSEVIESDDSDAELFSVVFDDESQVTWRAIECQSPSSAGLPRDI